MIQLILVILIGGSFLFDTILDWLNLSTWKSRPPRQVRDFYDEKTYHRARNYNLERYTPGILESFLLTVVLIFMLGYEGFGVIRQWTFVISENNIISGLVFFALISLGGSILSLPFDLYSVFVIEEKYGFNRTDTRTFFLDRIKGALLGGLLGGVVLAVILLMNSLLGLHGWWVSWIIMALFIVMLNMFYTTLIVPLFNTLRPMEEGQLKQQIMGYLGAVSFPAENIFVIDGSKRSTKANAFFSGFGSRKKVVLYDTMLDKYEPEEIVSVLAHEVGHYKKRHIIKGMFLSLIQTGVMLFLLFAFMNEPSLARAAGAPAGTQDPVLGLFVFFLLYSPISGILSMVTGVLSRRHEYQADHFAKVTASAEALISALKRLSVDHLSNLHPHPLVVFFHYSHPPSIRRIEALRDQ